MYNSSHNSNHTGAEELPQARVRRIPSGMIVNPKLANVSHSW